MKSNTKTKLLGTLFEEDEVLAKQNAYNIRARDEKNKVRWTGAFTGGFVAGYNNTVGSKEGWTPAQFRSSRTQKAEMIEQTIDNFMDEEDLESLQINKNLTKIDECKAFENQTSFGKNIVVVKKDTDCINILNKYKNNVKVNNLVEDFGSNDTRVAQIHQNELCGLGAKIEEPLKKHVEPTLLRKRRYIDSKARVNNFDFGDNIEEETFTDKVNKLDTDLRREDKFVFKGIENEFISGGVEVYEQVWEHIPISTEPHKVIDLIIKKNLELSVKNKKIEPAENLPLKANDYGEILKLANMTNKFVESSAINVHKYGIQANESLGYTVHIPKLTSSIQPKPKLKKGDIVIRQIKKIKLNDLVHKRFQIKLHVEEDFTEAVKNMVQAKEKPLVDDGNWAGQQNKYRYLEDNKHIYKQIFQS